MNIRRIRRAAVALAAAGAVVGGAAEAYARTRTVTVSTTDTVIHASATTPLSTTGGVFTTVLTAKLPVGNWVLSASGDLVDYGPSDYTRCRITVGGQQVAYVTTIVGDGTSGGSGPAGIVSPFSLTGGDSLAKPATARLQCWHDATRTTSAYVDTDATLYVHKTGSLAVTTE